MENSRIRQLPPAGVVVAIAAYFALGSWKGTSPNLPYSLSDPKDGTLWFATCDRRNLRVVLEAKRHWGNSAFPTQVDTFYLTVKDFEDIHIGMDMARVISIDGRRFPFTAETTTARDLLEMAGFTPRTHLIGLDDGKGRVDIWDQVDLDRLLEDGMVFSTESWTAYEEREAVPA